MKLAVDTCHMMWFRTIHIMKEAGHALYWCKCTILILMDHNWTLWTLEVLITSIKTFDFRKYLFVGATCSYIPFKPAGANHENHVQFRQMMMMQKMMKGHVSFKENRD